MTDDREKLQKIKETPWPTEIEHAHTFTLEFDRALAPVLAVYRYGATEFGVIRKCDSNFRITYEVMTDD